MRYPVRGTIKSRTRLQQLFDTGVRIRGRNVLLIAGQDGGPAALAFIAGKRLGGATVRNRAKRRLRAAAAAALRDWPMAEGAQLVLVANTRTLQARFGDLVADIRRALVQAGQGSEQGQKV